MEENSPVDLTLRLGPPGQVQEGAGPSEAPFLPPEIRDEVFDKINTRLLFAAGKKTGWQPPIGKI